MTDRQLIEAYAGRSDSHAFNQFVERHESALLSFAAVFLRDETLAQDVVQETFLRAARDPQRLLKHHQASASPCGRNWLLKVVRDISVDSLRRKSSERKAVAVRAEQTESASQPLDALEQNEELQAARQAIDRLRPRLRELLILKVREKKSYKEIAEITGLSATNVGFLLHTAMLELKAAVAPKKEESALTRA